MINPLRLIPYLLWLLKEILSGTWDVMSNLFKGGDYGRPMIVQLPLRCVTDIEITSMAQSITITPGTLVVATAAGTSKTPPTLFVHSLFGEDEQDVLDGLYDMEDRLLKALRGEVPPRRSDQL